MNDQVQGSLSPDEGSSGGSAAEGIGTGVGGRQTEMVRQAGLRSAGPPHRGGSICTRTLALAPIKESLAPAREFVRRTATETGLDEARVFDAMVTVSEATANAVEHGRPIAPLELTAKVFRERVEFHVFSESKFEPPTAGYLRTTGQCRGMGFPLMAKLSDHFALYSRVDGGTLVILTFFRPGYEEQRQSADLHPSGPWDGDFFDEERLLVKDDAPILTLSPQPDEGHLAN